jgi:gamma-glutamyltranspeptidase/glutathione hydrolase
MRAVLVWCLVTLSGFAASAEPVARFMIVTANPLASQAGAEMLKAGGSAVDAAIAAQMVLTLVEPQSSGIGGGAFLVHHKAGDARPETYDGRETAPAAATPDLFLGSDGQPMKWSEARIGGRAVGVPGTVRMLALAHKDHGRLPWSDLFMPAIRLAREGFAVSPRLNEAIASQKDWAKTPAAAAYFLDDKGEPWQVGHILKNPALAATLAALADSSDALYEGVIAEAIVAAVKGHAANPGTMAVSDLLHYQAKKREPVCGPFQVWRICGMPPPSSGPLTLLMILGLAERLEMVDLDPASAAWAHLFAEASKVAFADRDRYMADPDFVPQPVSGLLDAGYLDGRAALISRDQALGKVEAGVPPGKQGALRWAPDAGAMEAGTSHLSVVDGHGNVVSMTTTVEASFGSHLMVLGFLLNNELTDFSFAKEKDGQPVANRVDPGKRPRSSMAPLIAYSGDGWPVLAAGSPGGSRIIGFTAAAVLRVLGHSMSPQGAVAAGHVIDRNTGTTELEVGTAAAPLAPALEALGHTVKVVDLTSGLHLIQIKRDGLVAGVDPRREGAALGD